MGPVLGGEALPGVVEAPGRVVEREDDHDHDREHQVGEREDPEAVIVWRRTNAHACASGLTPAAWERLGIGRGGHPASLSVPTTRVYTTIRSRMAAMRITESAAAWP